MCLPLAAHAQTRFSWGLEWGYSGIFLDSRNFNYFSTDGVRVQDSDTFFEIKSCGLFLVNAGINIGRHFNAALYAGYSAVYEARKVLPYSLRATYFFRKYDEAGWKVFMDAGSAYPVYGTFDHKPVVIAKAGAGYRIPIYRDFCLDGFVALQFAADHPLEIRDKFTHQLVPAQDLNRSDRNTLGFIVGLSLSL